MEMLVYIKFFPLLSSVPASAQFNLASTGWFLSVGRQDDFTEIMKHMDGK